MLKSHEKFHSANGKRQILVVDDEEINREILGLALEEDYEVLYGADGQEALDLIRLHSDTLSIVLLDLMMPRLSGIEVLKQMRADPATAQIPVMVVTADQTAEIESLDLGALDFIPKPYPQAGIIQARIRRIIELSEDRQIIQSTERDAVTGLYHREFFYRYAEQYDNYHQEQEMDAIVLDVNHFHMINERYGKTFADDVLRRIGERAREAVSDSGGIVCRRAADTFLIYCPHREEYRTILEHASVGLTEDDDKGVRVRLRMGVYARADKSLDIERRFDRAKVAADTVRNSFSRNIGLYDSTLHEQELYAEQLIEDFSAAIRERQFLVLYQPKFDIRPDVPILASAEALVRWKHPKLGMISPGVFIPLFEENGLIPELDAYVWRETARQIREWKDRFGFIVPVSVNVSRVDMYDPRLIPTLAGILVDNQITSGELLLEITESAYTDDFDQIIETVNQLRALGFKVEMDDFGTGYSSLNMISDLPIDALKLDMQFIRNAFKAEKDTRMLEVIIDIADYLSVPVIAEGVETEEQLNALKAMGCDLVQGYFFSKPVPPGEYEVFLMNRKEQEEHVIPEKPVRKTETVSVPRDADMSISRITQALTGDYESIYYVDTRSGRFMEFHSQGRYRELRLGNTGTDFFAEMLSNVRQVVHPDDQFRVTVALEKETLVSRISGGKPFLMTYRLMIGGVPTYYVLKAALADTRDGHHIVIGVSNIDGAITDILGLEGLTGSSRQLSGIAQALASDFDDVYYINAESGQYTELISGDNDRELHIEDSGQDFFHDFRARISRRLHPEDQAHFLAAMERKQLLAYLERERIFMADCRMMTGDVYVWYRFKAVRVEGDFLHIVLGVSDIDQQVNRDEELSAAKKVSVTFSNIAQALAADYFALYYVNIETDAFVEFSARDEYLSLHIEKSGEDFFRLSRKNILRVVCPEDQAKILQVFTRENLLRELDRHPTFSLNYRLMFDGVPTYVSLKASRMGGADDTHIVIGVRNIDAQVKMEETYARELDTAQRMAMRDALTGVKSANAFHEAEAELDARLVAGDDRPFAVLVCDVNGLKEINDELGHTAGNEYLKTACRLICTVFKHSPVYRIGGDEFAAILEGQDYENWERLAVDLAEQDKTDPETGQAVIAYGISALRPGEDAVFRQVFARADRAMYQNKKQGKEERG